MKKDIDLWTDKEVLEFVLPGYKPFVEKLLLKIVKKFRVNTKEKTRQNILTEVHKHYGLDYTGSNSQISEKYYIVRGFNKEEYKKIIIKKQRERSSRCIEYWMKQGFTEEEAKNKISTIQKESSQMSKEYWIKRGFTKKESNEKVTELGKARSPRSIDYWIKRGFTIEESIKKVSEHQSFASLESLIKRYGEKEGRKKHQQISETRSKQYKGFFTLPWCIEKYGEIKGRQIYEQRRENCRKGKKGKCNEEWFIKRYGKEEGLKKYSEYCEKFIDCIKKSYIKKYGKEKGMELYLENCKKLDSSSLEMNIKKYGEKEGKQKFAQKCGFSSFEDWEQNRTNKYSFKFRNKEFREHILKEQSFCCGICNGNIGNIMSLNLHHIDYDKNNDDRSNLIWLCDSCHGKTNFNRKNGFPCYN